MMAASMSKILVAQQVVNSVIIQESSRDQNINSVQELSLRLSKMCKEFNIDDETQTQTGFHVPLSQLALNVINIEQYKDLLTKIGNETEEIESELKKLNKKYEEGRLLKQEFPRLKMEYKQAVEQFKKNSKQYKNETKEMDKKLEELGYSNSLSEESMNELENMISEQESELAELMTQLNQLDGADPNDAAIRKKLAEMKEQLLNDSNLFE